MTATVCTHRLGDRPDALVCVRPAGHALGHVFYSTSGIPDRHTESSGE